MVDPNMELAYQFASGLGRIPALPQSLTDSSQCAGVVNEIDRPFAGETFESGYETIRAVGESIAHIANAAPSCVPDLAGPLEAVNILLRLWAGCLMAAKTIATETRSGPNTAALRQETFASVIDPRASADHVFRAGVQAAIPFKKLRGQSYSLDGVPKASPVRAF
jgi:hypothetical protein